MLPEKATGNPSQFFKDLKKRTATAQQQQKTQQTEQARQRSPSTQPQEQQRQPRTQPPLCGINDGAPMATGYDPSLGQQTNGLLTQATQQPRSQPQQQQQKPPTAAGQLRSRIQPPQQQSDGQVALSTSPQQRVHAAEVIERVRRIRNQTKNTSPINAQAHASLLPPPHPQVQGRKCLILDVDETLVHSSYQDNGTHDVHLPIVIDDGTLVNVYVAFRPHLYTFLDAIAPLFEVVIFTASLAQYCDPLIDAIDPNNELGDRRLFRDHCSRLGNTFVKDLSLLGRDLDQVAIIDNSPVAYLFQQRNAIPIQSWFDDPSDRNLLDLIPVLHALAEASTVYDVLDNYNALMQLQQQQQQQQESGEEGQ